MTATMTSTRWRLRFQGFVDAPPNTAAAQPASAAAGHAHNAGGMAGLNGITRYARFSLENDQGRASGDFAVLGVSNPTLIEHLTPGNTYSINELLGDGS